jgi:hypothetical protein
MPEEWRGVSNAVLYGLIFKPTLDDSEVDRIANELITEPLWTLTPQQGYDRLVEALRSDVDLNSDLQTPHSDAEYREFLKRLVDRMDALRPWPELPFQELDTSRWSSFVGSQPIARIDESYPYVQGLFHRVFTGLEPGRSGLILRLKSGTEVAFVAPWWPESDDVAILRHDPQIPAQQVIDELHKLANLDPELVTLGA